jgi:stearoyl-CoA desaturase (delta-9 desaturase)
MDDRHPAGNAVCTSRRRSRVKWRFATAIILLHFVALLAFLPWFFSWTGVVLMALGFYGFSILGVSMGYHRLLTHRSFTCPRWLEHSLVILGVCCLQESPSFWVALHRQHHQASDRERDPHSPLRSFLWGHIGWLVIKSDDADPGPLIARYAQDLSNDPLYRWLDVTENWLKIALLSWVAFFVAGLATVTLTGGTMGDAIQFGASLMVWGVAVRTVLVWHVTWSVNSVTHLWGSRSYETPDNSRNSMLIALFTAGEGWHNNHHASPGSAKHGHAWYQLDLGWLTIRALMMLGLVHDVALPAPDLAAVFESRAIRHR